MATTLFSTLINGQTISPYDPNVDILQFDDVGISAGAVQLVYALDGTGVSLTALGKTVLLPTGVLVSSLTTGNITFANGSLLVVGDNSVITANDGLANTLVGSIQGDYLSGLAGADTMRGGQGSDTYVVDNVNDVVDETPFINNDIRAASTTAAGVLGSGFSVDASLSADGNRALFTSNAIDLVAGDDNFADDIFVKDLQSGAIQLISADANGVQGNSFSAAAAFSADGSQVVFESIADNLVAGDDNFSWDIFVKDPLTGAIQRVSTTADGTQADSDSANASFSADGSRVVFESNSSNLVVGDTNGSWDIFIKDLQTGAIQRVSTDAAGVEGNGLSTKASLSDDGRYVVFESDASNLVAGDTNGTRDIFVKNLQTGAIQLVSSNASDDPGNGFSANASLSADGRYVVFDSFASNLLGNDTSNTSEIFIKDLQTGAIQRASTNAAGTPGNGSSANASLSADGRYVVFESTDSNLVAGDNNFSYDVFVKNLQTGAILRVSTDANGAQTINDIPAEGPGGVLDGISDAPSDSIRASFSADGRYIVFESIATNLVAGDLNASSDVFRVLNPYAGLDTVLSSVNYALPNDIENLTLTGTADINGTGNGLNNLLVGNSGANLLDGGVGNDVLDGGAGNDSMAGGLGNDTYVVAEAGDVVTENAGEGIDTVNTTLLSYILGANLDNLTFTGTGNFIGRGNTLTNQMLGGAGNDVLIGGAGNDSMAGGAGNDTYEVTEAGDVVTENAGAGIDTVWAYVNYTLIDNVEQLVYGGTGNLSGTGNALNNLLIGNSGDNVLDGGAGNDIMRGGLGNDTYVVAEAGDVVTENAGEGIDTVNTTLLSYTLGANLDNLTFTGTGNFIGRGNTLTNQMLGGAGNDVLIGGAGNDSMAGGAGNDTYEVTEAGDVVTENAGAGIDTVWAYVNYTLIDNVEQLVYGGTGNLSGTGNALNNLLIGNSGANTLNGGLGNDTLTGGAGNDLFIFNTAPSALNRDTITDFVSGQDRIGLSASVFTAFAGQVGNTVGLSANLIYNAGTGLLAYDADGAGAGAAVDIAVIGTPTHPAALANDFLIMA